MRANGVRRISPDAEHPFRVHGERAVALTVTVVFGVLALISSITVDGATSVKPLVFLAVVTSLVTVFVFTVIPRLERREAGETAARPCKRARQRADPSRPLWRRHK